MALPVGPHRYLLQRQLDGRILATDQIKNGKTLLAPTQAHNGQHGLSRSGALEVRAGQLVGLVGPARSSGYVVEAQRDGTIRFRKTLEPQWTLAVSPLGTVPRHHFAVLDLRDGRLLLVDRAGVWSLTIVPALLGQAPIPGNGMPDFQYSDDFAP